MLDKIEFKYVFERLSLKESKDQTAEGEKSRPDFWGLTALANYLFFLAFRKRKSK